METANGGHSAAQHWVNGFAGPPAGVMPNKRKRGCETSENLEPVSKIRSSFIQIDSSQGVYYSERWQPSHSTLYLPVTGSLLANMNKYDQISFEHGCFFIGDESGGFRHKAQGHALHCWRYSKQEKKLFIALSYLFPDFQVFQDVLASLGGL